MQLSAPAPASFSDVLLPVSTGEVSSDAAPEGEASASDFGALFAGLTRPPAATPAARAQSAIPASGPEKPVSKLQLQGDEASVTALLAALVVPVESAPPTVLMGNLLEEGLAPANNDEPVAADGRGEDLTVGTFAGASSLPVPPAANGAGKDGSGAATAAGKNADNSLPAPGKTPLPTTHASPASPATPATPAVPVAAGKVGNASLSSEPAPGSAPVETSAPALAAAASTPEMRRLAAGVSLATDVPIRGLKRGPEMGAHVVSGQSEKTAAKIAAVGLRASAASSAEMTAGEKNFLSIDGEMVVKPEASVGTGVAIREPVMTTSAPASASPAIVSVAVAPREMGLDLGAPPSAEAKVTVPEQLERLAHRAVEAVTETIERGASQTPHSVNLKFSVQGADLMVRVALRAEEVQVTFRTDSEDLRNALAQEWQLVRGRDADGVLQSVTPVFTAGDSGHSTSQQHAGGRDQAATFANLQAQADAQSQRQFSRQAPPAPVIPVAGTSVVAGAPASASRPLSGEASGAARLLHTFA